MSVHDLSEALGLLLAMRALEARVTALEGQ